MPPPLNEQQMELVCSELQEMSLRRQQLSDRQTLLAMLKEFRRNAGFHEEGVDSNEQDEYEKITEELNKISEKKRQLQVKKDAFEHDIQFTGADFSPDPSDGPATPTSFASQIYFVDKPPPFPAPQVILDIEKLPPHPSQTQCPYCQQYITTEITTATGNTTWIVCMVCTFICCIAGCCLIPFCMDSFKDIVHKCPKCRSQIHACKKL